MPAVLNLYGSALAPWFDAGFRKSTSIITATKGDEKKKGATTYFEPSFVRGQKIQDKELAKKAGEAGSLIVKYLEAKEKQARESMSIDNQPTPQTEASFAQQRESFSPTTPEPAILSDNDTDTLPF